VKISKALLVILVVLTLANPVTLRLLYPAVILVLGAGGWYLVFKGIKAVIAEKKRHSA
jgi:hypothetical protein